MENLQLLNDATTKLTRTASTQGCTQQVKYVGNTDVGVFCFGFYFMSPKWTRTKLVIEISPSLQAY